MGGARGKKAVEMKREREAERLYETLLLTIINREFKRLCAYLLRA